MGRRIGPDLYKKLIREWEADTISPQGAELFKETTFRTVTILEVVNAPALCKATGLPCKNLVDLNPQLKVAEVAGTNSTHPKDRFLQYFADEIALTLLCLETPNCRGVILFREGRGTSFDQYVLRINEEIEDKINLAYRVAENCDKRVERVATDPEEKWRLWEECVEEEVGK